MREQIRLSYDRDRACVRADVSFLIKDGEEDMCAFMRLTNGSNEGGDRVHPLHTHNLECVIAMLTSLQYRKEQQAMKDGGEVVGS